MKPWKVQKFFGDIVYDLRSRGLLPVVILLLVAMVAVPMLISRGSGGSGSSVQQAAATTKPAPEGETAVVSYTPPGLRDYKKRLNDLSPKDPFRQQFASSAATAASLSSTVTTPTVTGTGATTTLGTGTPTTVGGTGGGSKHSKKKKKKATIPGPVTFQVNVLAGDVNTTLTPFNNVASMTALPSQTTPVVIYFGLSSDYTQALFLVSNKVGTVTGPGTCAPAPDDCALLSLKAGESEDLPYSGDGKTYRIVVAQINRSG